MWTFLIGGGHYFYHDDAGQETVTTGIMVYDPNVKGCEREKHAERLKWLGYASRFFNEGVRNLDRMEPHNELVKSGHAYCLANPGEEYAVYSMSDDAFTLDLSHAEGKTLVGRFYDPRTGQYLAPARIRLSRTTADVGGLGTSQKGAQASPNVVPMSSMVKIEDGSSYPTRFVYSDGGMVTFTKPDSRDWALLLCTQSY
jgi:hypothetical protein